MTAQKAIKTLARTLAKDGLRLPDARYVFDALYVHSALKLSDGNQTKAARLAGVNRECLIRMRRRPKLTTIEDAPDSPPMRCAECDCEKGGADCNWIRVGEDCGSYD